MSNTFRCDDKVFRLIHCRQCNDQWRLIVEIDGISGVLVVKETQPGAPEAVATIRPVGLVPAHDFWNHIWQEHIRSDPSPSSANVLRAKARRKINIITGIKLTNPEVDSILACMGGMTSISDKYLTHNQCDMLTRDFITNVVVHRLCGPKKSFDVPALRRRIIEKQFPGLQVKDPSRVECVLCFDKGQFKEAAAFPAIGKLNSEDEKHVPQKGPTIKDVIEITAQTNAAVKGMRAEMATTLAKHKQPTPPVRIMSPQEIERAKLLTMRVRNLANHISEMGVSDDEHHTVMTYLRLRGNAAETARFLSRAKRRKKPYSAQAILKRIHQFSQKTGLMIDTRKINIQEVMATESKAKQREGADAIGSDDNQDAESEAE